MSRFSLVFGCLEVILVKLCVKNCDFGLFFTVFGLDLTDFGDLADWLDLAFLLRLEPVLGASGGALPRMKR